MRNTQNAIAALVAFGLIAAGTPAAYAAGPDDAAAANAAMLKQIQEQNAAIAAAAKQREEEATLSPKERKALEKRRKAEERAREKERQRAEAATKPKSSSKVGNAVAGCIIGGVFGALLGSAIGGKKGTAAGAALGCAGGIAVGLGLTKKDQEAVDSYVADDFLLRDDVQSTTYTTPEEGKQVNIAIDPSKPLTYEAIENELVIDDGIDFDPSNIKVYERVMRSTGSLNVRSGPSTSYDVVSGFAPNQQVYTYGQTMDGQWTYIVDKEGHQKTLVGYVSTKLLSTQLQASKIDVAKAKPVAKKAAVATTKGNGGAKAVTTAKPEPRPKRTETFIAQSACKSLTLSTGGKSTSSKTCSGGKALAVLDVLSKGVKWS